MYALCSGSELRRCEPSVPLLLIWHLSNVNSNLMGCNVGREILPMVSRVSELSCLGKWFCTFSRLPCPSPLGSHRVTQSPARARVRGAEAPRRKIRTFDPSEFSHPLELDSWRNSWSRTRQDATSDSEEEEDEDYEDDEDEPSRRSEW